ASPWQIASIVPPAQNPVGMPENSSTDSTNLGYSARLAEARGTRGIAAGQSGAGDNIPAAAQDASCIGACRSGAPTRDFRSASSNAIEPPTIPPPTITTSYVFTGLS